MVLIQFHSFLKFGVFLTKSFLQVNNVQLEEANIKVAVAEEKSEEEENDVFLQMPKTQKECMDQMIRINEIVKEVSVSQMPDISVEIGVSMGGQSF